MRSWLKYIFLLIGTLLALYIGADMNYFIPSSELVYSEIEFCVKSEDHLSSASLSPGSFLSRFFTQKLPSAPRRREVSLFISFCTVYP